VDSVRNCFQLSDCAIKKAISTITESTITIQILRNINNTSGYSKSEFMLYFFLEIHMENQINVGSQNTQQIGQNPVSQPVVLPEKPKTNYLLIAGIVLVCFVVFGIGGYFLGMKQWSTKNSISEANLPNPTSFPPVTNTPVPDETVDWKVYSNTAFNYSLKYPMGWQIGVKGNADPKTFSSPFFSSPCTYDRGDLCTQINVQTTDMEALKKNDPDYYKTLQPFDPSFIINQTGQTPDKVSNKITMKVAGEDAVGFDYYQSNYGTGGRLLYVVVTNHNGIKYTITYEESQKNRTFKTSSDWQDKKTFDQILSTFKITTPTITNVENQIGYIKSVFDKNNGIYLTIDYIQWLTQTDGTCRSNSDGNSSVSVCNPNGYLIVNDNLQPRTFEIANNVVIDFSDFKNAGLGWKNDQQLTSPNLTLTEFQEIFSGNDKSIVWLKDAVYRVEINGNKITKIRYQYQP